METVIGDPQIAWGSLCDFTKGCDTDPFANHLVPLFHGYALSHVSSLNKTMKQMTTLPV